jgi:hypothetical protein
MQQIFLAIHFVVLYFRNGDDKSHRLGAVVAFGAWLPMLDTFRKGELVRGSSDTKTGPLRILQV